MDNETNPGSVATVDTVAKDVVTGYGAERYTRAADLIRSQPDQASELFLQIYDAWNRDGRTDTSCFIDMGSIAQEFVPEESDKEAEDAALDVAVQAASRGDYSVGAELVMQNPHSAVELFMRLDEGYQVSSKNGHDPTGILDAAAITSALASAKTE